MTWFRWLAAHPRELWLAASYLVAAGSLAIALGHRLRTVRLNHEQIAAMHRRRLGL